MRAAIADIDRYLATPTISKYRLFSWQPQGTIPNHAVVLFARRDDYFFGVLHSRAHEVWSLRMGTALEDRPRYTPTTCFETFPLPWPPGQEPSHDPRLLAIADAARELNELRERWLNPDNAAPEELKKRTLTNLYNQKPTWLVHAHGALDRAVWMAYEWHDQDPASVGEESILSRLLALNLERTVGAVRSAAISHDDRIVEPATTQPTSPSESSPIELPVWIADGVPAGELSEPDGGTVQAASGGA
jgi:hypothetical protein